MSSTEKDANKEGAGSNVEKEAGEGGGGPKAGEVKEVDPRSISDRTEPKPSPSPDGK